MTKPEFDFAQFSDIDVQEQGIDVPILNASGQISGLVIKLTGPHSTRRKVFIDAFFAARQAKGIKGEFSPEEAEALRFGEYVAATVSWTFPEGFDGPACTKENVEAIYRKHRDIFNQVQAAADKVVNFTKASPKS